MIIIADSSPLIALAFIDQLNLLTELFEKVIITKAVFDEITQKDKPQSKKLENFFKNKVVAVDNQIAVSILNKEIDLGEAESIILALEKKIKTVLIDDLKARKYASLEGLNVIGSLGVLLKAKQKRLIKSIKPFLDQLISNNIRIGETLYNKVLELAEEV